MSCGCNDGDGVYNNVCNADTPYPIISSESVPSLIANLTLALYGQIQKDISNGKIVWIIPCDPNNTAYIGSLPRNPGEGLLCYLIRYFNTVYTGSALQIPYGGTGATTAEDALDNLGGVPTTRQIITAPSSGLSGGGDLSVDRSLSIANTGVVPRTYGDSNKIPVLTVNSRGQLTQVSEVSAEGFASVDSEVITAANPSPNVQQTVFNLTTITYSPGTDNLAVYRNGIRLLVGLDYTETNSNTVTLTRGVAAGNQLLFESGRIITQDVSAIGASMETKTATAQQSVFALTSITYVPGNNSLAVYRNGLKLMLGVDYVETNSATVTLTSPAALGDQFVFEAGKLITETVSSNYVTFLQAGTGAVQRTIQNKAREIVSVLDFGADSTGATNSAPAFNAALASGAKSIYFPAGTYRFNSKITYTFPNPSSGSQDTDNIDAITIFGDGADVVSLYWPSTDGMLFNYTSQQHALHLKGLSVVSGSTAGTVGLEFTNSYAFFGTFVAQSDIADVTFRGSDGYANTKRWGTCVKIANVSDINFNNVNFYGESNGTSGTGVSIASPGAGCFTAPSPTCTCGTVYNFVNCNWSFLGTGFVYGAHTQAVQIVNSFFAQCETGIYVPPVSQNTLQGLSVSNTTFFCFGDSINIQSDLPNFFATGNFFTVNTAKRGIFISPSNNFTIVGNQFLPYGDPNVSVCGIEIASTTSGSIGVIDGNTFSSTTIGIVLGASSAGVKIGTSNHFTSNVTPFTNAGNGNIAAFRYNQNGFLGVSPSIGFGYGAGAGGVVSQGSSNGKSTVVSLNKICGKIITNNASLGAGNEVAFTVLNTSVASEDIVYAIVGNGNYQVRITDTATNSFTVRLKNLTEEILSDNVAISFLVFKSAIA